MRAMGEPFRLVAQAPWEAVRDHLDKGGSPYAPLVAVLVILALAAVLCLLNRVQQRGSKQSKTDDPKRLFRDVLRTLDLSIMQRDLLRRMAADLRPEHPTVMLLTPELFAEHADRWQKEVEARGQSVAGLSDSLASLAAALFGQDPQPPDLDEPDAPGDANAGDANVGDATGASNGADQGERSSEAGERVCVERVARLADGA